MGNLSKIAGTVLGTTTVAALPLSAGAGPINESFPDGNDNFPGQPLGAFFAAGDIFNGINNGNSDPIDFLHYTGLPVGGSFNFLVQITNCSGPCDFPMQAGLYTDQTTLGDFVTLNLEGAPGQQTLTGLVPGDGQLSLGVKLLTGGAPAFFEGYTVTLSVTPPSRVPQPATIALLLAGLTGLQILRRRKRR